VNIEKTDLESKPLENEKPDDPGLKSRPGPGKPSEPPIPSKNGPPSGKPPEKRRGGFLVFLAFLFSLAALALAAWTWWQGQASGSEATERVYAEIARLEGSDSELGLKIKAVRDEVDALSSEDVDAAFRAMQQRMEDDRVKMAGVEQAMAEQLALSRSLQAAANSMQARLQAAEAAVAGLSTLELDAGGELDLAEVDYLLRLANERLKLFADPGAADDALEVADMHLAALNNPMYLGVRQDIASARTELAAVEMPDYLEIAMQLDSVQAAIPSLVFIEEEAVAAETAPDEEEGWWGKTRGAFSSLVTVRRSTDQENERISLEDRDFVRQRVWLGLEVAHLGLMRRDQSEFHGSLERVRETIGAWFAPGLGSWDEVEGAIDALLTVDIEVDVPDITAPWNTLRLLRSTQQAAPPAPAPAVEEGVSEDGELTADGEAEG
jgi:uroporphyrin-3 C-methyltransferase